MISIENKFDMFTAAIAYTSVILMSFTFLGIFLNGEKVWVEPNNTVLLIEMVIFLIGFVFLSMDFWLEVNKIWNG